MNTSLVTYEPAETLEDALNKAAKVWGIQTEFWDIWGNRHIAEAGTLKSILSSLGVDPSSREQLNLAMEEHQWQAWSALVPRTLVLSATSGHIHVNIPDNQRDSALLVEFLWEGGERETFERPVEALDVERSAALRGEMFSRRIVPLPTSAPLGYHRLRITLSNTRAVQKSAESRLILCPDRAYIPEELTGGQKAAGIAVSLYGLRSRRNWGVGDLTDLRAFADWAAEETGASFIGLNPLHAIPNRQPFNTSPYLPACTFFRNPLYLDIESVPDFQASRLARRILAQDKTQRALEQLRSAKYVEYEKVWDLKRRFLKLAFREFLREYKAETERAAAFRKYIEREGEPLDRYAIFCALEETIHNRCPDIWIWPDWPAEFRHPESPAVASFPRTNWRLVLFYKYIQWQLDLQIEAAQKHALSQGMLIGLYHDLALATDRCGGDLWAHRDFYVTGARVGSPPDDFSPKGQDWAFPPPNSRRHFEDGCRLFAESIRQNSAHGGALRIDHVMRFFRLYWIPDGKEATQGAYVRDRHKDLLHILALESVRNRVIIVGEDLGTVEPEVREELENFGVLSYRLLYFEKRPSGAFKRPEEYTRQALVSVSTHDLPTLAGFWENRDIEARRAAGLLPDENSYRDQLRSRGEEKQRLLNLFSDLGLLPSYTPRSAAQIPEFTGELHNAAVGFLALTPSMLFVINQEDLFKDPDQQNLPGSTAQYPNWRHKMRFAIEELRTDRLAKGCTAMFRHWLEETGRLRTQVPAQSR